MRRGSSSSRPSAGSARRRPRRARGERSRLRVGSGLGLGSKARRSRTCPAASGPAQLASVVLEGGNVRSASFAKLCLPIRPQVLVLDEPTNDLDVGTLRALSRRPRPLGFVLAPRRPVFLGSSQLYIGLRGRQPRRVFNRNGPSTRRTARTRPATMCRTSTGSSWRPENCWNTSLRVRKCALPK